MFRTIVIIGLLQVLTILVQVVRAKVISVDLGPAGLGDNISAAANHSLPACFLRARNQGDLILKIDVHEEGALLVGEMALHRKKSALQRLRARLV